MAARKAEKSGSDHPFYCIWELKGVLERVVKRGIEPKKADDWGVAAVIALQVRLPVPY
jgi:hypothetical protein